MSLLPASQIIAQSGGAQSGIVGTNLANPLVVKVAASDGVGVAGTTVNFAVASGGGSVANAAVISDANGLAQTTFKLGTGTGVQSVTATSGSLTNSPLTFSDTAKAATATKLIVSTQPVNGVAGTALAAIVVTAEDNNGNVANAFTGAVSMAFGTNTPGATLGGTTTVNAVAGVATFSTLAINKNGTAFTLVASSTGLTSATTSAFDVAVGAPKQTRLHRAAHRRHCECRDDAGDRRERAGFSGQSRRHRSPARSRSASRRIPRAARSAARSLRMPSRAWRHSPASSSPLRVSATRSAHLQRDSPPRRARLFNVGSGVATTLAALERRRTVRRISTAHSRSPSPCWSPTAAEIRSPARL